MKDRQGDQLVAVNREITLFTPTYARDFERFCLLRESVERFSIELPHIAVVHHADVALFQTVPHRKGLTIVSTLDVLPREFERRRQVWRISRRDYRYWITGRGIPGWTIQQLIKLASPKVVRTDGIVCLDSDCFFIGHLTAADFYAPDGRLHLYESTDDLDIEMAEWYPHALRFLGHKTTGVPLRRFTHAPVPLHRGILLELQAFIEARHKRPWMNAVEEGDMVTEYALYGSFCRHNTCLDRVVPTVPPLCAYYWWPEQVDRLPEILEQEIKNGKKIALVQSNIGRPVSAFRPGIEQVWKKVGEMR